MLVTGEDSCSPGHAVNFGLGQVFEENMDMLAALPKLYRITQLTKTPAHVTCEHQDVGGLTHELEAVRQAVHVTQLLALRRHRKQIEQNLEE